MRSDSCDCCQHPNRNVQRLMEKELQNELVKATILYRLGDCKETIPTSTGGTRFDAISGELDDLYVNSYITKTKDNKYYVIDEKGQKVMAKLVGMYDQFLKFEVFATVDIATELTEDVSDDGENVFDDAFDPRFENGDWDLRPAMMAFAVESAKREGKEMEPLDPRRIIFLTKLANKEFTATSDLFWAELKAGAVFTEIEAILDSLRTWQSLGDDDEDSFNICQNIYTMGMLEARKRDGARCGSCGIPLAVHEANAQADNETLDECPGCGADFREPPPPEEDDYECPACGSNIKPGQSTCHGCGARVDFSLPAGTVSTETVEETVTETSFVYDDYYAYDPYWGYDPYAYGYYDPWYPAGNALALGFVCGAILF